MKNLLWIIALAAAGLCGGCSDDDDKNTVDLGQLGGKWEVVKEYDGEYREWDEEFGEQYGYVSTYEFDEDQEVCTWRSREMIGQAPHEESIVYTYDLDKNVLTFRENGTGEPKYIRIDKLTGSELVFAYDYVGADGGNYTDKEYMKRIL